MALSGSFLSMSTIAAYIVLSFIKFVTSTPGRLKVYLGLVLTITNLTKVLWSFTTIDLSITMKVLFWTLFLK